MYIALTLTSFVSIIVVIILYRKMLKLSLINTLLTWAVEDLTTKVNKRKQQKQYVKSQTAPTSRETSPVRMQTPPAKKITRQFPPVFYQY